jgi:hypothetical protein
MRVESGTQSTRFNLFNLFIFGSSFRDEETEFEETSDEYLVPIRRFEISFRRRIKAEEKTYMRS